MVKTLPEPYSRVYFSFENLRLIYVVKTKYKSPPYLSLESVIRGAAAGGECVHVSVCLSREGNTIVQEQLLAGKRKEKEQSD